MATPKQYFMSKTNWANGIWLALVVMLGSWDIPGMDRWVTPEAVAFMSLVINVVMRGITTGSLEDK
jgi:hypothetical protein